MRSKFSTLVDKVTKEYVHIIGNNQLVNSELPMLLDPGTTLTDLRIKHTAIVFDSVFVIDIELERKNFGTPKDLGKPKDILKVFPRKADPCPACGNKEDADTVLIYIAGTAEDNVAKAQPMHLDCILKKLVYYPKDKLVAFPIPVEDDPEW